MARKRTRYASDEVMRAYRRERSRLLSAKRRAEKGEIVTQHFAVPKIPKVVTESSVRKLQSIPTSKVYERTKVNVYVPLTGKFKSVTQPYAKQLAKESKQFRVEKNVKMLRHYGKMFDVPNYNVEQVVKQFKYNVRIGYAVSEAYDTTKWERDRWQSEWYRSHNISTEPIRDYEPYEPPSGGLSGYDYIQYFDPSTGEMAEFIEGYQPVGWVEADSYDNWNDTDGSDYYINRVREMADQFNTSDAKEKWNQAIDSAIRKSGRESVAKACADNFENNIVLNALADQVMTYEGQPMSSGYKIAFDLLEDALCDLSWAELHPNFSNEADESGAGYNDFGGNGKYR